MTSFNKNITGRNRKWLTNLWSIGLLLLGTASCHKEESNGMLNLSSQFASCNQILAERCTDYVGDYCLLGFKFGEDNDYSPVGTRAAGPQSSGGVISYSFQEASGTVSTHRQINIPNESFSNLPSCAKSHIRSALSEWSAAADLEFEELSENSSGDIMFFAASISIGGVAYTNFVASPCDQLAGHVILNPNFTQDCDLFYVYVLHEIGHALGLGHSGRQNVMGALRSSTLTGLQPGDIEGIRQIYGE